MIKDKKPYFSRYPGHNTWYFKGRCYINLFYVTIRNLTLHWNKQELPINPEK